MPARRGIPTVTSLSPFWVVTAAALLLRLAWIAYAHPVTGLVDDAGYYDFFARSILHGEGYVRPEGTPTAFWPVGYPATLAGLYAIFGESFLAAKLFNALLGALTAGLVYLLARRWLGPGQAMASGLVYACFPGAIGFTTLTMSEPLFTFLFVASLYLVARASESDSNDLWWALAFGIVAAAAAYVRGQALALPFFAAAWLLMAGWRWWRVVPYLAVTFAVVIGLSVPWLVRNTRTFDQPTFLSTNFGINLWLGHNPGADGGFDFQQQLGFAGQFNHLPLDKRELAWNREGFRQGVKYMLTHPIEEVRLSVQKVGHLYRDGSDAVRWNEQNGGAPIFSAAERTLLRVLFDGYFYGAGLLALAGFVLGMRRRDRWLGPVASAVVLWTLAHVMFFGEPRLHVPILPLLSIVATVPIAEFLPAVRRRDRRPALSTAEAEPPRPAI